MRTRGAHESRRKVGATSTAERVSLEDFRREMEDSALRLKTFQRGILHQLRMGVRTHLAEAWDADICMVEARCFPAKADCGEGDCSICLEALTSASIEEVGDTDNVPSEDPPRELPCGHLFHERCLGAWLLRSNACPLCRRDLAGDIARAKKSAKTAADKESHRCSIL